MITRWDYSKSKSSYHFDPTKNEDANPPFKIVGNIKADLAGEVARIQASGIDPEPNGFLNRMKVQANDRRVSFTHDMDVAELEYLNLPQDHVFFLNLRKTNSALVERICKEFKFLSYGASFHIQKPGQTFPIHIDEIPLTKNNDPNSILDKEPERAARFEIQVYDWQPGHVWAFGNTYWKQWKAGDIAWHDWRSIPHGTSNISRSDRITLQVTGLCSEETKKIIRDCNFNREF